MKRTIKIFLATTILLTSLGLLTAFSNDSDFQLRKHTDIFFTLFRELRLLYVDDIDVGKVMKTAIDEMLLQLDPYTVYYPETQIEDVKFMTSGEYGGVGGLIEPHEKGLQIAEVYEGFPLDKHGIEIGDLIISVNGSTAEKFSSTQLSEMLKGKPKTTVALVFEKLSGQTLSITLEREVVKMTSVSYYAMLPDSVGYIKQTGFTQNTATLVAQAVSELMKQNPKGLILDLRGNPGGLLIEAVAIVNLFVPKGSVVVETKGKMKSWNKSFKAQRNAIAPNLPLAVLVNRRSASASEIVSGALQDYDRAVVVGRKTFGKGLVQVTRPLSYNTQLKLTTAKYYIPSGRCIQMLDYANRNEDGSVGNVPDSLISEFKTQNGRIVKDGGGVTPDIETANRNFSKLAKALSRQGIIFDFVNDYIKTKAIIAEPEEFVFEDALFNKFVEFVLNSNFSYESKIDTQLKALLKNAELNDNFKEGELVYYNLQDIWGTKLDIELHKIKNELVYLVSDEIVLRKYHKTGSIRFNIASDEEVARATEILLNTARYTAILQGEPAN